MTITNAVSALRALLLTNAPLVARVTHPLQRPGETRATPQPWIFGGPEGLPASAPTPCWEAIVIRKAGGAIDGNLPYMEPRYYLLCYGPDGYAADELFGMVMDVFYDLEGRPICNRVVSDRWFLSWAIVTSMDVPSIEPDSTRPFAPGTVMARWELRTRT